MKTKNSKPSQTRSKQFKNFKLKIKNSLGLVISGGTTQLIFIEKIGKYKIIATTGDDALGEALDKAARMLGLGYPGGAVLEKIAKEGNVNSYALPLPMKGREKEGQYSYSGLKTAMWRLIEKEKPLKKENVQNLAATFQNIAFTHLVKVTSAVIESYKKKYTIEDILIGGGVGANVELRKKLRRMAKEQNLNIHFPYTKKLYTDNAAMIGAAAYFKAGRGGFEKDLEKVDRMPRARICG